jgi:hypothetical protein
MAVVPHHGKVSFGGRHRVFRYVRHVLLITWALFSFPILQSSSLAGGSASTIHTWGLDCCTP